MIDLPKPNPVSYQITFQCDLCDRVEISTKTIKLQHAPGIHKSLPTGWSTCYGYILCNNCVFEHELHWHVNRRLNHTLRMMSPNGDSLDMDMWREFHRVHKSLYPSAKENIVEKIRRFREQSR